MRTWICKKWGGPNDLSLGDLTEPVCTNRSVKIRADAWGVNFADLVLIAGQYQARPSFPFAPGMEVSGVVVETSPDVAEISVGDKVAAYVEFNGYADLVVAPVSNVARIPKNFPCTNAAAFPVPFATASLAIERANLQADEYVLIGGAGGAVGLACVQLAKLRGAKIVAATSSTEKAHLARESRADFIVSSHSHTLVSDIKQIISKGVDVVFDPIGGSFFEETLKALRFSGRMVTLGFTSGTIPSAKVNQILVRHISVIGSSLGLACYENPEYVARLWPRLANQLSKGEISPSVSKILSFKELPNALTMLASRSIAGRIVLI